VVGVDARRPGSLPAVATTELRPDVALRSARDRLHQVLVGIGPVVVAFSGGVDSALLAHEALRALGHDRVLAATARSASLATGELERCRSMADRWQLRWAVVDTDEMAEPSYVANDADRCAWCKDALMDQLLPLAAGQAPHPTHPDLQASPAPDVADAATVVLGVNLDDLGDHRPGQDAARRRGARFPLVEAGLSKADVRALARDAGLDVWDRPSQPCLSSRIPYGTPVTLSTLSSIDRAEAAVRSLGFSDVRVRHLGDTARVEVPLAELAEATEPTVAQQIVAGVRSAGYRNVTLDLEGLRSGNLNDALRSGSAPLQARSTAPLPDNAAAVPAPRRSSTSASTLGHTLPDLDRMDRVGIPEAVYAAGKTPVQVVEIVIAMLRDGADPLVVTRTGPEHRAALSAAIGSGQIPRPDGEWSDTLTWRHAPCRGDWRVTVVSGGTSDQPVLDECRATLTALGADVSVVADVGVAGLHRLLDSLERIADARVVVALAGMEASLPTVLGGLISPPIVAVPTSTGYGASLDGVTALLSLMSSCAPGVSVVGIDNGYGAACATLRILAS